MFHTLAFKRIKKERRRGIAAVYTGFILIIILMLGAITVDLGRLYVDKAAMQKAADSAALAGAYYLANGRTSADAQTNARYYAGMAENGNYVDGVKSTQVLVIHPAKDESGTTQYNWIRVSISRRESTFLARIFKQFATADVGVTATAIYEINGEFSIKGLGVYGVAPGGVNLSVFGPDGLHSNGDRYSTKKLNNGKDNPEYDGKGYDFLVKIPADLRSKSLEFDVFDPDTYNNGDVTDAGTDANGKIVRIDEYRKTDGAAPSSSELSDPVKRAAALTNTKYTLWFDNGTPGTADDTFIDSKTYGDLKSLATQADRDKIDMQWNDVFRFKPDDYVSTSGNQGQFRLNVTSIAGASENGFDLRVGLPLANVRTDTFDSNNGTVITADGHIPINFNTSGTVKITLGTIPTGAAGGQLNITKFDTDVAGNIPNSITYSCSTLPNWSAPGVLAGGDAWVTDSITVPTNYTTAGIWYATYTAGQQDTSVWDMSFTNSAPGTPGTIKLIR